jgi:glycosyltransferase involved in cell wall biosynthesis
MKVFNMHVGSPVEKDPNLSMDHYYERFSIDHGESRLFLKKDIVNTDDQMVALENAGLKSEFGYFGGRKNPITLIKTGFKLRRFIKNNNIQLVHARWGVTNGLIAIIFSPVPVIISFLGSDVLGNYASDGSKTISGKISGIISKFSSLFTVHNVTMSQHLKDNLPKIAQNKTTVLAKGVDLDKLQYLNQMDAKKKLGWDNEEKVIVFFNGSGAFVKNFSFAQEVVKSVQREMSNVRFEVVENVPHEEVYLYYCASDVLLLTSLHEGSNNSIKEAVACNLPIVSSNSGDAKERLGPIDQCEVIDEFDVDQYSHAIIKILKSNHRSNGSDFKHDFSLETTAKRMITLYNQVIKKK